MRRWMLAAALAAAPLGAAADEVEEAIGAALTAYRAGDFEAAREELDFAASLLGERKAEGLKRFLPPAMPGWTRTEGDASAGPALLGGGSTVSADYRRDGRTVSISMMADNPMVSTMGAMLAEPAMMAMQGSVKRVGRQRYVETPMGELMALVDGRVVVRVGGDADIADKTAYLEMIDFRALGDF